jgi:nitrile hydratase
MSMVGAGLPPIPPDALRHQLERLPPIQYLSSSYYERWLARIDAALVEAGTLTREEIDRRMQEFAAEPDLPMPRREDPIHADSIATALRAGRRAETARRIWSRPRFIIGEKIVTRNINPHGHTRMPRYARGKRGVIVAHHGAHVFPDTNAHGLGENPQHLYTVRIAARELWGEGAERNESVLIDLWESYLEKDKAALKPTMHKTVPAVKKVVAKPTAHAARVPARAASSKRSLAAPLPAVILTSPAAGAKSKRARTTTVPGSARSGRDTGKPIRRSR